MPATRRSMDSDPNADEQGRNGRGPLGNIPVTMNPPAGGGGLPVVEEPPAEPPPPIGGDSRGSQSPRERVPDASGGAAGAQRVAPEVPAPLAQGGFNAGGPVSTPPMPSSPSPVAAAAPAPFTPMTPAMSAEQQAAPVGGPQRVQYGQAAGPRSALFGSAGGLLGGGLGVPGSPTHVDQTDISQLLKLLGM